MPTNIVKAIDSGGTQYFPITHVNAVRDSNGTLLPALLEGKSDTGHTHSQYLTGITSGDVITALGYTPANISITYSGVSINANQTNVVCPVTLVNDGDQCNVLYINNATSHTITVSTNYKTPDGSQLNITVGANGYAEINYLKYGSDIFVRGV